MAQPVPAWEHLSKTKQQETPTSEYADLCATVFSAGAGRELLVLLHKLYVDAAHNETSSARALRAAEAKRSLVRELEEQTAAGLAQRTRKQT